MMGAPGGISNLYKNGFTFTILGPLKLDPTLFLSVLEALRALLTGTRERIGLFDWLCDRWHIEDQQSFPPSSFPLP